LANPIQTESEKMAAADVESDLAQAFADLVRRRAAVSRRQARTDAARDSVGLRHPRAQGVANVILHGGPQELDVPHGIADGLLKSRPPLRLVHGKVVIKLPIEQGVIAPSPDHANKENGGHGGQTGPRSRKGGDTGPFILQLGVPPA